MCHGGRLLADFSAGTTDRPDVAGFVARSLTTTADGVWVVWAHKYAYPAGDWFRPLSGGRTYPADAIAECSFGRGHEAPDPDCTCGFHAITGTMRVMTPMGAPIGLDVALSGRVLAFEFGAQVLFRAARQTVMRIRRGGEFGRWRPTEPGGRLARLAPQLPHGSGPVRLAIEDDPGACLLAAAGGRGLGVEPAVDMEHLAGRRREPVR